MSKSILLLHSGDSGRDAVEELATALARQGSKVAVADLASGDYDRILDLVAVVDTVAFWPAGSGD